MSRNEILVKKDFKELNREELEKKLVEVASEAAELEAKVKWYEAQMRLAKQKKFGASSEKTDENQLGMFDEVETASNETEPEPELEKIHKRGIRRKGNKEYITSELPVEIIEYRLSAEEQECPQCGNSLHEMSKVVRKELTVIPAKVIVTEHIRFVYSCRYCQKNDIEVPVMTAPMPKPVIKNSLASPSLISHIMCRKYEEAIPLYRQEVQMFYYGLEIKRQSMANWIIYSSSHYLSFLYKRLHSLLLGREILHADETTVQVLREENRTPEQKSYMWMYRTGKEDEFPIVLYEYQPGRGAKHPLKFLAGFTGYIHADGYEVYNKLTVDEHRNDTGVIICGCWAHARRKYDEAIKSLPKGKSSDGLAVRKGLDYCNKLFEHERSWNGLSKEKRYEKRQKVGKALLDEYFAWAKKENETALPKGPLGKALTYSINQETKLRAYIMDGRLELSNNLGERSIKPFVIGRKNWMFSTSTQGADASAVVYSILETAKANKLHTFNYMTYLLSQLPNIDMTNCEQLDKLLPWSDSLPEECRKGKKK